MLKQMMLAGCILTAALGAEEAEATQKIYAQYVEPFEITKMQIENHTYFYIYERCSLFPPTFWHDPECAKCELLEITRYNKGR